MSERMRSPRTICAFTRASERAAEASEHLKLEELRIFETKPTGHFPQRRRLSLAANSAHAEAGVDGRALVCGEEPGIEKELPVRDGDQVGRDIG